MTIPRNVGLIWLGQSNQQGATLTDNGARGAKFTSEYSGDSEPFRLNANGGGSCLPYLYDLGCKRGVRYLILNGAIGGAELAYFPGRVGATIVGPTIPAATLNSNGSSMSAGTGVICRSGDAGFDPFGLLARVITEMNKYPQITSWIVHVANAESDGGTAQAAYRDTHASIADFFFARSDVRAYLAGLSSSGGNSSSNMNRLSAAVTEVIALLQSQGKNAARGADMYAKWGMTPPLYPERSSPATKVHLTLEGQRIHAELADASLAAIGY